ncbi:hypothetical protein NYO98_06490 [Nocardioides sp. STR2]|uniref:CBS domain-containing protein n=1 Tax=Nocardioides pini TaxID=2975053 RepID=A0ABT4CAC9_9ACTN|nr:hypothetical protein [Nocardioides pini]MCY4725920.1 hypothetical protein [Nocardioides pini]
MNTSWTRHILAISIISLSVLGIASFAGIAIYMAPSADRLETSQMVFTSVLPLFGTWVGTVLAFYFARENLQSATESTQKILSRALNPHTTPVTDVMIDMSRATKRVLAPNESPEDVSLRELMMTMQSSGFHRIPVVDAAGIVARVVHDSTINEYASGRVQDPSFADTIADLETQDKFRAAIRAIAYVGTEATISDARVALGNVDLCNDVFVTASGLRSEPALGWLTNTDLAGIAES